LASQLHATASAVVGRSAQAAITGTALVAARTSAKWHAGLWQLRGVHTHVMQVCVWSVCACVWQMLLSYLSFMLTELHNCFLYQQTHTHTYTHVLAHTRTGVQAGDP